MSQKSLVTLPVLVPPWNVTPLTLRTLNVDVHSVEVARIVSDLLRGFDQQVRLAEHVRVDVVERANRVATAVGQPRIPRCRDGVRREVRSVRWRGCRRRPAGREHREGPPVVPDFHRGAREDLLLHRHAEAPSQTAACPTRRTVPDRTSRPLVGSSRTAGCRSGRIRRSPTDWSGRSPGCC